MQEQEQVVSFSDIFDVLRVSITFVHLTSLLVHQFCELVSSILVLLMFSIDHTDIVVLYCLLYRSQDVPTVRRFDVRQ